MTRTLLLIAAILVSFQTKAQEKLSYGISGGTNVFSMLTDTDTPFNQNSSFSIPEYAGIYLGVFADYQLNNKFGIVTDFAYENRVIDITPRTQLSYFSISPKVKYDFGGVYNQGWYLKSGLRYSILFDAETREGGVDVKDAYNNGLFSVNLGIGASVTDIFGIEFIFDYSLTDAFDADVKSKLFGAYALLTMNLDTLIN
ncbi:MAG: porin family protein [Bacteroidota bacterium]